MKMCNMKKTRFYRVGKDYEATFSKARENKIH